MKIRMTKNYREFKLDQVREVSEIEGIALLKQGWAVEMREIVAPVEAKEVKHKATKVMTAGNKKSYKTK
jgi:hypothetical protein